MIMGRNASFYVKKIKNNMTVIETNHRKFGQFRYFSRKSGFLKSIAAKIALGMIRNGWILKCTWRFIITVSFYTGVSVEKASQILLQLSVFCLIALYSKMNKLVNLYLRDKIKTFLLSTFYSKAKKTSRNIREQRSAGQFWNAWNDLKSIVYVPRTGGCFSWRYVCS